MLSDELKFISLANRLPLNNFEQKIIIIISFIDWISVDETIKGRMSHQQFPSLTCDSCSRGVLNA